MEDERHGSVYAPNPQQGDSFPVLVLDVRNGKSNPPRLGFKQMHWHDDVQFVVVGKGSVKVDCAEQHLVGVAGDGFFFNSGVPHRIMGDVESEYVSFVFPASLLSLVPGSEMAAFGVSPFVGPNAQPVVPFDGGEAWHTEVLEALGKARALLLGGAPSGRARYRACVHLIDAWSCYIENAEQRTVARRVKIANERVKAFTTFIDENYGREVSLEDIARAGDVSKAECLRCFKEMLSTTPYAYLLDYRINRATELMRENELTMTAIAREVGFGTSSHFATAFKKVLGMTPSAYLVALRESREAPDPTSESR